MTYQETLSYLFSQLPMYQRIGNAAYNKSLTNILALCEALGNPQHRFRSVHVAGTNGKGSSSHMLAAVLQQAGYRTGLYTSPHLKSFTERIRLNGAEVSEAFVTEFVAAHKQLFEEVKPSFFEMTVAMAFSYFAREEAEVAVIEVGLGGRLDSTNIITPLVSLITNIGYDHQQILGDTLPQIAAEKAGIIKRDVPAVVSQRQPEIAAVFERTATANEAPLFFADACYTVTGSWQVPEGQLLQVSRKGAPYLPDLLLDLRGQYQHHNLPGVLLTLELLGQQGFDIPEEALREGLRQTAQLTGLKGRWQVLQQQPLTICDTGHNEDGLREVLQQLARWTDRQVHFVFGTVNDKDVQKILALLPRQYRYYFCQASIPRALPVAELQALAQEQGLQGQAYLTVPAAQQAATQAAQPDDIVFIGGSTFVVADAEGL